jgi:hypothetical protein
MPSFFQIELRNAECTNGSRINMREKKKNMRNSCANTLISLLQFPFPKLQVVIFKEAAG